MAKNKSPKIVTKKHLARLDRERRQTRIITGIAIGVIVIVILGIAYGLLNDTLFLNWRPAVTVNGESRSIHEFQVRVRVARETLINQYMQYMQLAQMFGLDPSSDPQMSQSLNQITSSLDTPTTIGGQVMQDMVDDLLIRQYAKANGISVTADEVEQAAQKALNYYPSGTPMPTMTPTELVYATLDATQLALITATPTPTVGPTATLAPSMTPFPTATPDLTATKTPIPSITPTATPYTLQGYQSQYQTALKNYSTMGLNDTEFRYIFFESGLYRDKVQAKVTADITHSQEQVWVRHILVADEATANTVHNQLVNNGDFASVAASSSIDSNTKGNGGDLGWIGKDSATIPTELLTAAFSMKVGEISNPISTSSGYDILQVLGHEVRPLTDAEYQSAVSGAFTAWLQAQSTKSKVDINSVWVNYVPTTPTIAQAQAYDAATSTAYVATYQAKSQGK
jgi:peptidyl-prolyl cis-trans isomerase D